MNQQEFDFANDCWSLTSDQPTCPLGDRPEDVEAWNYYHGDPAQKLIQFGQADLPLWKRKKPKQDIKWNDTNRRRHSSKIEKWFAIVRMLAAYYRKGGKKSIRNALKWAMTRIEYDVHRNKIAKIEQFVKTMLDRFGVHYADSSECTPPPPHVYKRKYNLNKHRRAKIKNLNNLAFAIILGRRPREGFGKKYDMNDPGWQTLENFHWDNCKVHFRPKMLFISVRACLLAGIQKAKILKLYETELHRYHGLATDAKTVFEPTGICGQLYKLAKSE